jgi:hypothetical protein
MKGSLAIHILVIVIVIDTVGEDQIRGIECIGDQIEVGVLHLAETGRNIGGRQEEMVTGLIVILVRVHGIEMVGIEAAVRQEAAFPG